MASIYRINPQFPMNFEGLVIDNFAGGGGASTGIEMALGRAVDIAINHDPEAVAMHTVNHPHTKHYCESVWDITPREITEGKPVELAWFSPDCKHFSKAKGAKPVSKNIRGLAWVALRYAATVKPKVIMLENVEEFITWGPLDRDGMPCPKNKGRTFNSFINALRRHGYNVEYKELRACDYGAPTIRKRLFLVARSDNHPIIWPTPTHGDPNSEEVKKGILKPWRTAAEIIDWSIPCPSIFNRKKPLAENTLKRIANGIMKYIINNQQPFIMGIGGGEYSRKPVSTHKPLGTCCATTNNKYLVTAFLTEHANASSQRNFAIEEPLRTLCAQVKGGHFALVAPIVTQYYGPRSGNEVRAQSLTSPIKTQTTSNRHALVQAFLVSYYGNSKEAYRVTEPLHTVTTKARFGLITIEGQDYQIVDIGMRMLEPHELYAAQGFPDNYIFNRTADGKKLTKTSQIRMCGNSVCPPVAAALVRANCLNHQLTSIEGTVHAKRR